MNLALACRQTGRPADAEVAIDETLALLRECGERGSTYYASALCSKAAVMVGSERYDEARALFEEGISRYEDIGDRDRSAVERLNYAELEFANGDIRRAIGLIETAIEHLRSVPAGTDMSNELAQVVPRLNLAACLIIVGDLEQARAAATAATDLACDGRYPLHMAIAVQHLATVAALKGDPARAARLLGFVNSVYGVEGVDREPTEARLFGVLSDALRSSLDDRRLSNLLEQGALLREEEAIAVALQR
jgi:tetratricopeptide (TPR) repeat protein